MAEGNFMFDGEQLVNYGYIVAYDEIVDEDYAVSSMGFTTVKSERSDVFHRVATQYEDTYQKDVFIMKNPCKDGDLSLSNKDISKMAKWLCRKEYKWFRWMGETGKNEVWHEVQITMDKKEYGDSVIGLVLHIKSNRPYGLSKQLEHHITPNDNKATIDISSDEEGYIYPNMTIKIPSNAKGKPTIAIYNSFEERTTQIANCIPNETITISGGDNLQIKSTNTNHDMSKDFNYNFFRLCNRYGKSSNNIYIANARVDIWIRWRGIRKVGL